MTKRIIQLCSAIFFIATLFGSVALAFLKTSHAQQKPTKYTARFNYERNVILAPIFINGKGPYNFMIDSGLYPSQISLALAKELGLEIGSKGGNVLGFGSGNIPYYPTNLSHVQVGELSVESIEAIAVDMSHFEESTLIIHGMLGHSFLQNRVTVLNYKEETLQFYDWLPNDYTKNKPKDAYVTFPLWLAGGKIATIPNLTINGKAVDSWLDTGCNVPLFLPNYVARDLGLKTLDNLHANKRVQGTRGDFSVTLYEANDVSIGAFRQDSVVGAGHGQGSQLAVGNAFLDEYIVTLDYVDGQVYLFRSGEGD